VTSPCKVQIFKLQRAAARDYRADPAIKEACQGDVDRLCGKDVKEGGGRKQACLVSDRGLFLSGLGNTGRACGGQGAWLVGRCCGRGASRCSLGGCF
jgi:hypothetical protein